MHNEQTTGERRRALLKEQRTKQMPTPITPLAKQAIPALPGTTPTPLPTPPMPFDPSVKQPTPEERAVMEAKWAAQRELPRSLAQLILLVNAHPEWLAWARAAQEGTMTFNG